MRRWGDVSNSTSLFLSLSHRVIELLGYFGADRENQRDDRKDLICRLPILVTTRKASLLLNERLFLYLLRIGNLPEPSSGPIPPLFRYR